MGAMRKGSRDRRPGEQRQTADSDNSDKEQFSVTAEDRGHIEAPKPKPRERSSTAPTNSNKTRPNRPERKRHDTGGSQQLLLGSGTSTDLSDVSKITNEPLSVSDISTHSANHLLNNLDNYNDTSPVPVQAQKTKRQRKSDVIKIESREGMDDRRESVT